MRFVTRSEHSSTLIKKRFLFGSRKLYLLTNILRERKNTKARKQ